VAGALSGRAAGGRAMTTHNTTAIVCRVQVFDVGRLRRYLRAVAAVADYAMRERSPREVWAAVRILRRDVPAGLTALEGRA